MRLQCLRGAPPGKLETHISKVSFSFASLESALHLYVTVEYKILGRMRDPCAVEEKIQVLKAETWPLVALPKVVTFLLQIGPVVSPESGK